MRRLILMRHARAASAPQGGEDIDRVLTADGRADALLIGKALAKADLAPSRALVSAATRTRQTWDAVAKAFPGAAARFTDGLYNADSARLLSLAQEMADEESDETVMILGHNPGIHAVAVQLLNLAGAAPSTIARMERGFPTATAVAFVVDAAGRMEYDGMFLASDLGGGAGE